VAPVLHGPLKNVGGGPAAEVPRRVRVNERARVGPHTVLYNIMVRAARPETTVLPIYYIRHDGLYTTKRCCGGGGA